MSMKIVSCVELSAAMVLAGSSVVAGKLITGHIPVFLSQGLSLLIALFVLFPASRFFEGSLPKMNLKEAGYLLLQAITGLFLFRIFILYGLKFTSASQSGILTSTAPAFTALLSFVFLKEAVTWNKIAGILAAIAGILSINILGSSITDTHGENPVFGNFLVLLAVFGEALFTILRKASCSKIPPITGTFLVTLFAFILFLPFSISEASRFDFLSMDYTQWLILLYYGIFITSAAYILWFRGVSKVPVSTAAVYTGFMPVSSVLFSHIILKEPFSWVYTIGILFVAAGIALISAPGFFSSNTGRYQENESDLGREFQLRKTAGNH